MSATLHSLSRRALLVGAGLVLSVPALSVPAWADDAIKFGLVAAMSGQSAKSGEAIVRGKDEHDAPMSVRFTRYTYEANVP